MPSLPVTLLIEAPETPDVASAKSPLSTFTTLSLNVTVKLTLPAFVGFASARAIEETDGTTSL